MIPLWALRLLPYAGIALAVAVAGALVWAHGRGVQSERAKWQKAAIVAERAAVAKSAAMQAQVDAAGAALSVSTAEIERLKNQSRIETRNYYVQNPNSNVACLAPERLRAIEEADKAAYTAATAK